MLSRLVSVVVFLLLSFSLTSAQVEFDVDTHLITPADPVRFRSIHHNLNDEEKVIVDFLYLTQKEEFCIHEEIRILNDMGNPVVIVCVFRDTRNEETQHLYLGESAGNTKYYLNYVLFYEGNPVAVLRSNRGIRDLNDGEYTLYAFYNASKPAHTLVATVSFSISSEVPARTAG